MTTDVFRRLNDVLDGIQRRGVVHVGAHKGQEVPDYRHARFARIVLVEPNPALWPDLAKWSDCVVERCACGPAGEATLHVTEWDERSSLLEPVDYAVTDALVVDVRPLGDLQHGCNVAVLDCQGSEVDVLRTAALDELDCVIVECSDAARYHGAATAADVNAFMIDAGWRHCGDYGGHSPGIVDAVWRHPTCA